MTLIIDSLIIPNFFNYLSTVISLLFFLLLFTFIKLIPILIPVCSIIYQLWRMVPYNDVLPFWEFYFYHIHSIIKHYIKIGITLLILYICAHWTYNYYITGENLFSFLNIFHEVECATNRLQHKYYNTACRKNCPTHGQTLYATPIRFQNECHCHFPYQHHHIEHIDKLTLLSNFHIFCLTEAVALILTKEPFHPRRRTDLYITFFFFHSTTFSFFIPFWTANCL
jgi:hypothetical protein